MQDGYALALDQWRENRDHADALEQELAAVYAQIALLRPGAERATDAIEQATALTLELAAARAEIERLSAKNNQDP